ncbi:iron-sulfur cluster biosynthesis family protein [Saccharibacillus sp. JS10]|uniref:iron-sulfur cluster biosynthesis family protein n=1 Tax=Saccharibacillus sp. JS10 TaxID=2950552 RepID=UPI00210A39A0|nr:iron-sulfur cluster biosynthesis family protein [Saccharibacillus sp. JS10]MCQ4085639.1 iron-sulfur cluster biosynthesis family protein [Saccharibacillus sp. JS10]
MSMSLTMKVSPEAQTLLNGKFGDQPGYLRVAYDNEGCGCSLSGAIALWLVDEKKSSDLSISSESQTSFIIDQNDAVYLDQNLSLTISKFGPTSLRLASDGQSYGSSIAIEDRRSTAEVHD